MFEMDHLFFEGKIKATLLAAEKILAKKDVTTDEFERAKKYCKLLTPYQLSQYPTLTPPLVAPSIERADETYEELDEVKTIRAIKDEDAFQQHIQQLEAQATTSDAATRAQSLMVQAQLFLLAHHYNEAVHCFKEAIKANPNHDLYWGLAGQTMHRFGWTPFDALSYLEQAVLLNPTNARWQWNQALVLLQLAKDLQEPAFLANASLLLEDAIIQCAPHQASLKQAIQSTYDEMDNYVFS